MGSPAETKLAGMCSSLYDIYNGIFPPRNTTLPVGDDLVKTILDHEVWKRNIIASKLPKMMLEEQWNSRVNTPALQQAVKEETKLKEFVNFYTFCDVLAQLIDDPI